jgi:hypothetical protein
MKVNGRKRGPLGGEKGHKKVMECEYDLNM